VDIHLSGHFSKPVDMRCKYNSNSYGWAQGFVTLALWVNGLGQGTALQITPSGMAQNHSCRNKILQKCARKSHALRDKPNLSAKWGFEDYAETPTQRLPLMSAERDGFEGQQRRSSQNKVWDGDWEIRQWTIAVKMNGRSAPLPELSHESLIHQAGSRLKTARESQSPKMRTL